MSDAYPLVPLGEIACPVARPIAVTPGASYRTFGVKWWGEGAYERETIDGADTAAATLFLIREGDLVINKIWVRHGSVAIASREVDGCAASNEFPTFELNRARVDPRWLHWLTKTRRFWEQCAALSFGTSGKNRIKPAQFLTVEVPLPPLEEQRRIVGRIEEMAERIELARGLRREAATQSHALIFSAMNELIDQELTERWPTKPLGTVADIRAGVTLGRRLSGPTRSVPYLRVANVQDGHLELSTVKEVEVLPDEVERWRLQPGDLLMTEGGDWDKLGRCAVWSGEIADCIHQNHIFRVRTDPNIFFPSFLVMLASSPYGKSYFQAAAKRTTNLATINQEQLRAFQVFSPPLAEQQRIMKRLGYEQVKVDALRRLQEQTAAELDALLPAVLERAFSGAL